MRDGGESFWVPQNPAGSAHEALRIPAFEDRDLPPALKRRSINFAPPDSG
jgi:hypothetical protein